MKHLTFDETRDFPYYNHNPRLSKGQWLVLLFLLPVGLLGSVLFSNEVLGGIFFCAVILIPLLYFSKWDYGLIFQKPSRNEVILAVLMFAGYMIYAIAVGSVLDAVHLSGAAGTEGMTVNAFTLISLIFSMMGEELLKFIPLMLLLRVLYKYTGNRRLSIIVSSIIVMLVFGLMHYYPPYNTLISVLLLQGLGTAFEMYGYVKTKNLFVPYIAHLLTDLVALSIIMMGFG